MSAGVGVGRRSVSIRSCASEVRKKEKGRPSVDWPAGWPSKNKSVCPRAMRLLCSACMRAPGRRHAAPAEGPAAACTSPAPPAARTGSPHACPSRPWPPIQAVTPSVRPALRHAGRRRARANGTEKWLRAGWGGHAAHTRAHAASRAGPPPSALRPSRAVGHGARDTPAAITARAPQQCKCTLRGRSSPLKLCKTLIKTPFFFFTHNE